jgi:hypothetical protein
MDAGEVHDRLRAIVAADEDPVLSVDQTWQCIMASRAPDVAGNTWRNSADGSVGEWVASTAYLPGQVIAAGDRYWKCIVGGVSDADEPSWPDLRGYPVAGERITGLPKTRPLRTVNDFGVVWADNGTEWAPTYDLDFAAMLAWERKAAIATSRYDFTTDGQTFRRGQVAAACREQAERYRRRRSGTTRVE